MELTKKQQEGLKIAVSKHRAGDKYVVISGYAGVGKSTLVKFIVEALNVDDDRVVYAAFTGKAAEVLRKKGNKNAMTTHKLLYDSFPRPGGGFLRRPKLSLDYDIVIIDEVSMLPKSMLDLLLRHKVFCIFLGDPFQLSVIDKNEAHNLLDNPDIFLDEVMRQAQESEIIRLTMDIRNGKSIDYTQGKEVLVLPKKEMNINHLKWADQVICATNKKRLELNNMMRAAYGYHGSLPQDGEKMLCLRNYWGDLDEECESALVNGMIGTIKNPFESYVMAPNYVKMKNHKMETIICDFEIDDNTYFSNVNMDKHMLLTGEKCIDWRESYALGKLVNKIGDIVPREFTFGYAITCHKAQGSQFEKVLVYEEQFPFDKIEHARWLYTAATRPESRLVLVR